MSGIKIRKTRIGTYQVKKGKKVLLGNLKSKKDAQAFASIARATKRLIKR